MIRPLYRYILTAALRDRFFYSLIGALTVVIGLSVFFGASALTEQDQFARTFAAFGFRLFGVALLVLFVVSYIRRSFDGRDVDYLLSRPIGRIPFVLTHAFAFSTLAIVIAALLGGTSILLETGALNKADFIWWVSLTAEFIIMANVAMFFAFVMTSMSACLIVIFAFYLLSRLMGEILGILAKNTAGPLVDALARIMEFISIFIPRLDLMAQSKWLLYGIEPEISLIFIFTQAVVFVAMVVFACVVDFNRRQF